MGVKALFKQSVRDIAGSSCTYPNQMQRSNLIGLNRPHNLAKRADIGLAMVVAISLNARFNRVNDDMPDGHCFSNCGDTCGNLRKIDHVDPIDQHKSVDVVHAFGA